MSAILRWSTADGVTILLPLTNSSRAVTPRPGRIWPLAALTAIVLVPAALWLATYFWLNSSPGQRLVLGLIVDGLPPDRAALDAARWGPAPDRVELIGVVITDDAGATILRADRITASASPFELLGGHLRVSDVEVDGFELHLAWDGEGRFNLAEALRSPRDRDRPAPPVAGAADRPRGALELEAIALRRGDLTLSWPRWGLTFAGLEAHGGLGVSPASGLVIDADLVGTRSRGYWADGRREVAFDEVRIAGFRWREEGFTVEGLLLDSADGSRVDVGGAMGFGGALSLDARGDARLAAVDATTLGLDEVPHGAAGAGLHVTIAGDRVEASAERLEAREVIVGPFRALAVSLPLRRAHIMAGLLRPTGAFEVADAHLGRFEAPEGVIAEDVQLGVLAVTVRGNSNVDVGGLTLGRVTLPAGELGAARGEGSGSFGLTSGTVQAAFETSLGSLGATASARIIPIRNIITVDLKLALEGAQGVLADTVLAYFPRHVAADLTPPLDGFVALNTRLTREEVEGRRGRHWVARTRLVDAQLDGRQRATFDGATWIRGAPEPDARAERP